MSQSINLTKNSNLKGQNSFFSFLIFFLALIAVYFGYVFYKFSVTSLVDNQFTINIILFSISLIVFITAILVYRHKYLKVQKIILKPKKGFRIISFIVPILGISLFDILFNGLNFEGSEILIVSFLIMFAILFQRMVYHDYANFKDRLVYSIYLGLSFTLFFVVSVSFYFLMISAKKDLSIINIFSSLLSLSPNSIARLMLVSPIIIFLSILSSFIHRVPRQFNDDHLDSILYK